MKRPRWASFRPVIPLLALSALPDLVLGQVYSNNDSIEVRGLVFIGKVERFEYAFDESIRAELVLANRTSEPISLLLPEETCSSLCASETWCLAIGDSCRSWPLCDLQLCFGYPYPPRLVTFDPGEQLLQRYTFGSYYPGEGWEFRVGSMVFASPWPVAPYWRFAVRYTRVGTEPVASYTWSAMKSLFR